MSDRDASTGPGNDDKPRLYRFCTSRKRLASRRASKGPTKPFQSDKRPAERAMSSVWRWFERGRS